MKKTLALVLALAMIFSTITVAFAEGTLGEDAQICADLGMLKGETGTVDAAYVATVPTRLQAAVMFLRLKGLEAEALAFTGEDNFADGNIAWAEGANLLAYLKANPQLGWIGDGTNFNPTGAMTAQAYYKVLLEALGYKQNTAEVVGDFAYADVIAFAAEKGLSKVATVENYTVNDLAIATVEALKLNVKGGEVTLAATLVEAGKIDAAKAEAAGLYTAAATTTDASVKAVKAIGNTRVEVEFTSAVEKVFAENAENYKIVVKGTTTPLEVVAALLDGTKKVVVETAAQTSGKAYTMTVGSQSINFGGVAKISGAAELDKAVGIDTERVELTFTKVMDLASALDTANYKIDGVTIESAKFADSTRKVVELTTKGLVPSRNYKVTVTNVKTVDLVVLKSASKNFLAKTDKTAPKISKIEKDTNTRIKLHFDEEVDQASAENIANYSITVGSSTATTTLGVVAAKLVEDPDNDDEMRIVEITTDSQKSGQKYVLHVINVADVKVLENKITKEATKEFYGKAVDDGKPTVTAEIVTPTMIQLLFADPSRLDFATALDINNYDVNNDITVEKAELRDADNADEHVVRLTVSEMGDKSSYSITIKNVADEYGNVMKDKTISKAFSRSKINTVGTIDKIVCTGDTTLVVYFTKDVDLETGKDVANYSINGDIGTPVKAKVDADNNKKVTLTTTELVANKEYKVTVNGVKDLAGNVMNVTSKVIATATENDIEAPEIDEVTAVGNNVVSVTFNEAINVKATPAPVIYVDTNNDGTSDFTGTYAIYTDSDKKVLEFTVPSGFEFVNDNDVTLLNTTAMDAAGNVCADKDFEFTANSEPTDAVELVSWEQITVKKFKLQFSEKVKLRTLAPAFANPITSAKSPVVPYDLTVTFNDYDDDDLSIVYLTSSSRMADEKAFELELAEVLTNYHDKAVVETDSSVTKLETSLEDTDAPYIVSVTAKNRNEVLIVFNEDMSKGGSYKISYVDKDGKDKNFTATGVVDALAPTEVTLTLGTALEGRYSYTLEVGTTKAADIALNSIDADATFDFEGTDVIPVGNYITGVKILNGTTLEVRTYQAIADASVFTVVYGTNGAKSVAVTPTASEGTLATDKIFTVKVADYATGTTPAVAFMDGTAYTVKVNVGTIASPSYLTSDFKGLVESDVSVEKVGTDWVFSYDEVKAGDVVVLTYTSASPATYDTATAALVGSTPVAKIAIPVAPIPTKANILILRNDVPLFYAEGVDLP